MKSIAYHAQIFARDVLDLDLALRLPSPSPLEHVQQAGKREGTRREERSQKARIEALKRQGNE